MQSVLHSVAQSNDKPIQLHVIISFFFFSGHAYNRRFELRAIA